MVIARKCNERNLCFNTGAGFILNAIQMIRAFNLISYHPPLTEQLNQISLRYKEGHLCFSINMGSEESCLLRYKACLFHTGGVLLDLILSLQDGGVIFLRNVG
jgi:hypothetical protein